MPRSGWRGLETGAALGRAMLMRKLRQSDKKAIVGFIAEEWLEWRGGWLPWVSSGAPHGFCRLLCFAFLVCPLLLQHLMVLAGCQPISSNVNGIRPLLLEATNWVCICMPTTATMPSPHQGAPARTVASTSPGVSVFHDVEETNDCPKTLSNMCRL